jgi:site-specific recombinase XerD
MSSSIQPWLTYLEKQGKSAHTVAAYQRALTHFTAWNRKYSEIFNPAAIIPRDVQDWKTYQQTVEKAAPATVNQRVTALTRFFEWAVSVSLIASNPAEGVKMLRPPARKPKALSERDVRKLLRATHEGGDVRDYALIEFLLGTGLRASECLALEIGDVIIQPRSGVVTVRNGKGGNHREIPLTAHVRHALSAYLDKHHPDRHNPQAALWVGQRGDWQDRASISYLVKKYALEAGLDPIGPHVLRHTFATRYLAANPGDLRGLAALLGHARLETVMIYTEPALDDLAGRMERVEVNMG